MGRRGSLTRQSPLLLLPLLLLLLNICTELDVFAVEVIGRPGENVTIRQGETAYLLCEIPSTAKQVAWLNRSAILFAKDLRWTQDQRISLERRSPTQYGLRVREVGLRDEGPYTCSLQGQGFPHTATLYLLVQVPPIITEISEDLTIEEGSNVTAFCSATGRPEPAVSWRHLSPSARMEEIEGEFLFLERVSRTQAGEYQCSAANDVTIADTRRLRLTVNYVPSDVEIRSTGMLLGRAGSLRCQASAVPLPWFTWSKEDHRLMDGLDGLRIRTEGRVSVLSFQNVTSRDYGNYSCSASNPLGTANASLLATRVTSLSYPVYSKGGGPAGRAAWSRRGSAGLAAMTAIFVASSFYL